ncbi:MAG: Crp/Fnr family transcriptional regulator [Ginsengibacter sp.]
MDINRLKKLFPEFESGLYDALLEHGEVVEITSGETLLRVGQTIRSTMLIVDGLVKLYREDDHGKEYFIYHLHEGQACSLSMVCAAKHETSELLAVALTDTTLLSVPLLYMEKWMAEYKSWYRFVISSYRDRFEELLKTIDAIAFSNMDERLIYYLRRHQENIGSNEIHFSITQIAKDLNSSREVISRLLKKLFEKNVLRQHRRHIEILDLDSYARD